MISGSDSDTSGIWLILIIVRVKMGTGVQLSRNHAIDMVIWHHRVWKRQQFYCHHYIDLFIPHPHLEGMTGCHFTTYNLKQVWIVTPSTIPTVNRLHWNWYLFCGLWRIECLLFQSWAEMELEVGRRNFNYFSLIKWGQPLWRSRCV